MGSGIRKRFCVCGSQTRDALTLESAARMRSSLSVFPGMLVLEAPAEDADQGEGEVADGDVGSNPPLGPVEHGPEP